MGAPELQLKGKHYPDIDPKKEKEFYKKLLFPILLDDN